MMHWSDDICCLYIQCDVMGIDTLGIMITIKQHDLRLINEIYESITTLLYSTITPPLHFQQFHKLCFS